MISSRVLGIIGLFISFIGTIGMLWGGLEAFIRVEHIEPPAEVPLLYIGNTTALFIGDSKLTFTTHYDASWHILANKWGKILLALGIFIQGIALIIDP